MFHTLDKPILVLIFVFALPIGGCECVELAKWRRATQFPVVDGDIVGRQPVSGWGGIPSTQLSIRVVGGQDTVHALVAPYVSEDLPARVRFHFSGNVAEEVLLEGERNPLWAVLFFWGVPFVLLIIYVKLKGRRGWDMVIQ